MYAKYTYGFDDESDMFFFDILEDEESDTHTCLAVNITPCPVGTKRHQALDEALCSVCEALNSLEAGKAIA